MAASTSPRHGRRGSLDGRGGADRAYGGAGNDQYYVDNAGDLAWEQAGEGYDTVRTIVSYTLTAGSEIERLLPDDYQGTAAINLTGNEFDNEIWGNYGNNIINGGAGADRMNGWRGNDTYIVDNPGDTLFENGDIHSTPENESEGFKTALTSVDFAVGLYSEIEVLQATGTGKRLPAGEPGQQSHHRQCRQQTSSTAAMARTP